jgi:hypothetical protein
VDATGNDDGTTWENAFDTITEAINAASAGNEIWVAEGTYSEYVNFGGFACILRSTNPNDPNVVASTSIDANGFTNGVEFESGEDSNSVLKGFTVMNATSAGVFIDDGSPVITQCILQGNDAGAEYRQNSVDTVISRCKIKDNTSYGIFGQKGNANIKNNLIYDNPRGIKTASSASAVISNNTLVNNDVYGIENSAQGQLTISNCIVWDCNDDLQRCSATYSCIQDGDSGTGNIDFYPFFEDYANNDFHITKNSPCVDRGDPNFTDSGQTDIDGDSRVIDGWVDMGADELNRNINLIKNPGFEQINPFDPNDPCDWTHYGSNGKTEIDPNGYSGNSIKVSQATEVNEYWYWVYQDIGQLIQGEEYEFSAMCKTIPEHYGRLCIYDTNNASGWGSQGTAQNGIDQWTKITRFVYVPAVDSDGNSTENHNWRVWLYASFADEDPNVVWYDDVNLTPTSMYLPAYGPVNEPNIAEAVDFGTPELNTAWVSDINDTNIISGPYTDSNDSNIKYRELKLGKSIIINFPAFNLDVNDGNFPATPMLLEIMLKDEAGSNDKLVDIYSRILYPCDDPNIPYSSSGTKKDNYLIGRYGRIGLDGWKYLQYAFQLSDFTLLHKVDGKFKIKIYASGADLPIDYISLHAISQGEYLDFADNQRKLRGFYEVNLPADAPVPDVNYADPNLTVFVRDFMHPVYTYTKPGANEPNSISIYTALGEYEGATFSIYSENGVENLTFEVADLNHTSPGDDSNIPTENISVYKVVYDDIRLYRVNRNIDSYALMGDRLEEVTGSISVDANTSQRFMFKAEVPSNINGGLYTGQISIKQNGSLQETIAVDVNVLPLVLDLSETKNPTCHDPYSRRFCSDVNQVFKLYRETGLDPAIYSAYPDASSDSWKLDPVKDGNGTIIDYDINDFNSTLATYKQQGVIKDFAWINLIDLWSGVMSSAGIASDDPNLYYLLDTNDFKVPFQMAIQYHLDMADFHNITVAFDLDDELAQQAYKRILGDRLFRQIQDINGLTIGGGYDKFYVDPCSYNLPEELDCNLPSMIPITDYVTCGIDSIDESFAEYSTDPNYTNFGYFTTNYSNLRNPVYNRFLHGLEAFRTEAKVIWVYALGDSVGDFFNDFDTPKHFSQYYTMPDYIFAYPTWDGRFLPATACEGIREGIKDGKYIATLQNILDDPNTDWGDPNVTDANDYLDSLKDRIDPNYCAAYLDKATWLGFYQPILEDLSDSNDPNDFEAFTTIRETLWDHINTIK